MAGNRITVVILTGTPGAEGTDLPMKSWSEMCNGEYIHISHHPTRVVSQQPDVKRDRPYKIMHSGPNANGGRFMRELGDGITIVGAVEQALALAKNL